MLSSFFVVPIPQWFLGRRCSKGSQVKIQSVPSFFDKGSARLDPKRTGQIVSNMLLRPVPTRLRPAFFRLSILGPSISFAVGLFFGWLFIVDTWNGKATQLLDEKRIWRIGAVASNAKVSGNVTTEKFLFHEYKLDVEYTDSSGCIHRLPYDFDTLGKKVPDLAPVEVRYLRDDPNRFALSWCITMTNNRWLNVAINTGMGLFLTIGMGVVIPFMLLRSYFDANRCLRDFSVVHLHILKVTVQMHKGMHTGTAYSYDGGMHGGKAIKGVAHMKPGHEPFFADTEKQIMIGLQSQAQPTRPVVLRDDLYPFDFSTDDAAMIQTFAKPKKS